MAAPTHVLRRLTQMIVDGDLLPGEQIRQESMAELLSVSRLPIREAMKQLAAAGLLEHVYNAGYRVVRLSRSEFDQVYLLRSFLETEVLSRVRVPEERERDAIVAACSAVEAAAAAGDHVEMRARNREFHFLIFRLSGLDVLVRELERVWDVTAPYHALYYSEDSARERVLEEHRLIRDAAARGDGLALAALMATHREGTEGRINDLLRRGE